ncbi:MAG: hypothetical protein O3A63_09890 [Proteobacteria bacterium]|nr:hypothetical protein [Pseudomonadota bacterium]
MDIRLFLAGCVVLFGPLLFIGYELHQSNRIAVANNYQARAEQSTDMLLFLARSDYVDLVQQLDDLGWPDNPQTLSRLPPASLRTLLLIEAARWTQFDNLHYQYQQGLVDEEFYNLGFRTLVRVYGPAWRALGQPGLYRESFASDLEAILENTNP